MVSSLPCKPQVRDYVRTLAEGDIAHSVREIKAFRASIDSMLCTVGQRCIQTLCSFELTRQRQDKTLYTTQ